MKRHFLSVCAALFALTVLCSVTAYAADNVYAILYDDGTLVFQYGDTPESGKNATNTYEVDLDRVYIWDLYTRTPTTPWYSERESVRVVNFADKISPTATAYWFDSCSNLECVDNIQNLDTSNVTSMFNMFSGCSGLTALDLSHFDTANVTSMSSMFSGCRGLTALDVSNFDTANVTFMSIMFYNCSGLTALDVSHFDTKNVTSMSLMFSGCSGLTALDVSNFDTANVTSMSSMFYNCSGLTALDVSNFDTKNVTDMHNMFEGCSGLTTLDVSHFDTTNVTKMFDMFNSCSNLKTIYASDKFTIASVGEGLEGQHVFWGCASLVGGNGTKYDSSHINKEYARLDTASAPGYFTDKNAPATVPYKITAAAKSNGQLSVTLTNTAPVTVAVSYFDTNGKFLSADLKNVSADVGSVTFPLSAAHRARVALFDSDCCPLCDAVTVQ